MLYELFKYINGTQYFHDFEILFAYMLNEISFSHFIIVQIDVDINHY